MLTWPRLLLGGLPATLGLVGMFHYGLRAVHVQSDMTQDAAGLGAITAGLYAIAVVGCLWAYRLRDEERLRGTSATALASAALGLALCHNAAIRSAALSSLGIVWPLDTQDAVWIALMISASTLFLMALGIITAILDRRVDRQTATLLQSLKESNARLEYSSRHDALTGLPNRATVYNRIDAITGHGTRETRCTLMYIDFDGFKVINDSPGHIVGDRLLKRAAATMRTIAGERHVLGRIGGDEFLLLLTDIGTDADIDALADRIIGALTQLREQGATLSASIGIALYPDNATDTTSLVAAADVAMYVAKRAGKHRARRYSERMGSQQAEAFQILEDLRRGIPNNELRVYYQPKYDAKSLCLAGAEALVRWQHPRRGFVSPGVFIEIAERGGLINDLERCVLDTVCREIRQWTDAGHAVPPLSINLSVARLLDEHLITETRAALARHGIAPRQIVFEITETLAMQEFDTARRVLHQLNELGLQLSLDDFGTGYSSLSYLQTLPIHQIKIDRSFIANLAQGTSQHNEIVKLMVDLAHLLGLTVVAEGIETHEQQEYLRRIDCDELQGFLLDRPMASADFGKRLQCAGHTVPRSRPLLTYNTPRPSIGRHAPMIID